MGKHLEQALPSVYTLQCLTGKVDNNNNNYTARKKLKNHKDAIRLQYSYHWRSSHYHYALLCF